MTYAPKTQREWFENEIYKTILRFKNDEIHSPMFADVWLQLHHWRKSCIDDIEQKTTQNSIRNLKIELERINPEYHMMRVLFERLIATMEKAGSEPKKHTLSDGVRQIIGMNRTQRLNLSHHESVIPHGIPIHDPRSNGYVKPTGVRTASHIPVVYYGDLYE